MTGDTLTRPAMPGASKRPWGFWATIGLGLVVVAAWVAAQFGVLLLFSGGGGAVRNGASVASVALLAGFPVGTGLTWLFARIRRMPTAAAYLGLLPAGRRALFFWLAACGAFLVATELAKHVAGLPSMPENIVAAYRADLSRPLFVLSVAVAAPIFEELLFRGFLYRGLAESPAGPWGAIVLTTAIWGALHFDYPAHEIAMIFAAGVLLGVARWRTGSLLPPLAMHLGLNAIASAQLVLATG